MNKSVHSLNDFKIIKQLGSTNKRKFNQVFLVSNKNTDQKGVLKILIKTFENQHIQDLLRHELSLNFQSNYLPNLIATFEDENSISFINEYKEGVTLNEYFLKLKKAKRIDFIFLLLKKLTPLFEELEQLKLVHGDIRLSNILISGTDLDFEVHLIDFGLSFFTDKDNSGRKLVFPLAYAAPELILNKLQFANQSTDLYALGICLFQLFTGKLPFTHNNPAVMTNLQLTYPIQLTREIPSELTGILLKMCYKFPFPKPPNYLSEEEVNEILKKTNQGRFQNLKECVDELESNKCLKKKSLSFWKKLIQIFSIT